MKISSSSTNFLHQKNSTLNYMYDLEFKKTYKDILEKNGKLKNNFNNSTLNFNFSKKLNTNILKNYNTNFLLNYLNNNLFENLNNNTSNNIQNFNINNNYNIYNITENFSLKNFNFNNNNNYSYFSNNYITKNYYEFDKLEEVEETSENLRVKNNKFSIKLIKGILNKHNINLLNNFTELSKNILFTYKSNTNEITQKISQILRALS